MTTKRYISWAELEHKAEILHQKITNDGFEPDAIIGISRGGLVPGIILSHKFDVPFIPLRWSTRDHEYQDTATIDTISNKFSCSNLLVVDDICDTGKTFETITDAFPHSLNIEFATLHVQYSTEFLPKYFAEQIVDDIWIVYPYEVDGNDD